MKHMRRLLPITVVCLCAGVMALAVGKPVLGCSTPVYRYAMYNWASWPYYVFYFHHGAPPEEDKAVNKLFEELPEADPPANVMLTTIDVSKKEEFDRLPEVVRKAYQTHADGKQPLHLVMTSRGVEMFAGRLDDATVRSMIASPKRTKLAELLGEGNAAILLTLTGPDAAENQRAEKVVNEVIKEVSAEPEETPDEYPDAPEEPLKVAAMKVSRTDPAEKWLVRMLLVVEPDLHEFPKDAMIFAAYGRGRVMPPYLGKGINTDNLFDCIAFLAGACSCMVKQQNPGVDLLMQWDWEATADALAETDEQLNPDLWGYQEYDIDGPEDPANPDNDRENHAQTSTAQGNANDQHPSAQTIEKAGEEATQQVAVRDDRRTVPDGLSAEPLPSKANQATTAIADPLADKLQPSGERASFAARQAWKIGLAVVTGAILVVALGALIVLRQRPNLP